MSLETLHTDAHRRLVVARSYPARIAIRAAIAVAVRLLKTDPTTAAAMQAWHSGAGGATAAPPATFTDGGGTPAFALIGVATRKPMLVIGAIAGLAALPILLLSKLI